MGKARPPYHNETIAYKKLFPPQFHSFKIPSQFENPTTEDKEQPNIRYDDSKDISELARDEYLENGVDYEPAIRKNVLRRKGWKDSLVLKMIPVKFQDDLENYQTHITQCIIKLIWMFVCTLVIVVITCITSLD